MGKGIAPHKHAEENNSIPAIPAGMPDVELSENAFEVFRRLPAKKKNGAAM
jgi:hypothetical protein